MVEGCRLNDDRKLVLAAPVLWIGWVCGHGVTSITVLVTPIVQADIRDAEIPTTCATDWALGGISRLTACSLNSSLYCPTLVSLTAPSLRFRVKNGHDIYPDRGASGELIDTWTLGLEAAHGLTISHSEDEEMLFITDYKTQTVYKTTLWGQILMRIRAPEFLDIYSGSNAYLPTGTAVSKNGDVYIADGYGSSYIIQYDVEAGTSVTSVGGVKTRRASTPPTALLLIPEGRTNLAGNFSRGRLYQAFYPVATISKASIFLAHTCAVR